MNQQQPERRPLTPEEQAHEDLKAARRERDRKAILNRKRSFK